MNRKHTHILSGVSVLALALTAGMPADAQDEGGTTRVTGLDEIVVTARRQEESLQTVPVTVDAVSQGKFDDFNLQQFEDVEKVVPGLRIGTGGFGASADARGADFDITTAATPTVEFYINEAPVNGQIIGLATFDTGQTEFLRGPQGTLRGRSSPSGSLTVTTRRPDLQEIGGYIQATGTLDDALNINGAINIPIVEDVLAVRVAGLWADDNGSQVDSLFNSDNQKNTNKIARISARLHPTEWFRADVMYQHGEKDYRTYPQVESAQFACSVPGFVAPAQCGQPFPGPVIRAEDRLAIRDDLGQDRQETELYVANVEIDIPRHMITYVGGFSKNDTPGFSTDDDINLFKTITNAANGANIPPAEFGGGTVGQVDAWTHEVRIASTEPLFDIIDYAFGGFHQNFDSNPTGPGYNSFTTFSPASFGSLITDSATYNSLASVQATPGSVSVAPFGFDTIQDFSENSVYGNVTIHITDKTELSGGIRQIWFSKTADLTIDLQGFRDATEFGIRSLGLSPALTESIVASALANPALQDQFIPNESKDNDLVWSANLSHQFTDSFMAYGNIGTSFRGGPSLVSTDVPNVLTPRYTQYTSFGPESSKSYEVGIKSSWFENRVTFNISGFQQKYDGWFLRRGGVPTVDFPVGTDIASLGGIVPAGTEVVSAANYGANVPARVRGFDALLAVNPFERFNFSAQYSYNKGKITGGELPCLDVNGDGVQDDTPLSGTQLQRAQQIFTSTGGTDIVALCSAGGTALSEDANWQLVLTSEYNHPVFGGGMEAFIRGLYGYEPATERDVNDPLDDLDAFGSLDMFWGLRDADGGWDVTFFGTNLTNEQHYLTRSQNVITGGVRGNVVVPYRTVSLNDPREFGIRVRKNFGGN